MSHHVLSLPQVIVIGGLATFIFGPGAVNAARHALNDRGGIKLCARKTARGAWGAARDLAGMAVIGFTVLFRRGRAPDEFDDITAHLGDVARRYDAIARTHKALGPRVPRQPDRNEGEQQ